jgi:hypothetical protein
MRTFKRAVVLVSGMLLLSALTWQMAYTQSQAREYFAPTGHWVEGSFLNFYRAIPNPELIYGYPITEAFFDTSGLRVQYFQRARFELNPSRGVTLTPLGRALYAAGNPPVELNLSAGACRTFEGGFAVCTSFLRFFDEHGGAAQFGSPISPVEYDGGRFVQYFEFARFEWYPDTEDARLDVQLAHLGRLFFDKQGEDPARLLAVQRAGIIEILQLRAHLFAEKAAVASDESQAVFVILQDQNFAPVAEAAVTLKVTYPSGGVLALAGVTNAAGFARFVIPVGGVDAGTGMVMLEASAQAGGVASGSVTSFRISP